MKNPLFIPLIFLFSLTSALPHDEVFENTLEQQLNFELDQYIETGVLGDLWHELAEELDFAGLLSQDGHRGAWKEPKISAFCTTCHVGINRILAANTTEEIFQLAIDLCIELGIGNDVFCDGIVTKNEAIIEWLVINKDGTETANDICGMIFVTEGCTTNDPKREWNVTMPDVPKPPIDEPPYPMDPISTLKILHLADTHFDPKYLPGSNAVCPEKYFCCNAESGPVNNTGDEAGFWGDYRNCDIPLWTIEAMYASIAEEHPDIDMIIWTGDIVPHIVWDTSREGNLKAINTMAKLINDSFPNIPVFPAVGNHEADPLNNFPQDYITDRNLSLAWLYEDLEQIWDYWLPTNEKTTILKGAFYSTKVLPGLRLISINTNMCYELNWFLIHDNVDVDQELNFMAQELQAAEDVGDSVYIIGHHPPGNHDCQLTWSREFNKVVSRYESTVSAVFSGHTHKDHFSIFFDPDDPNRPYGMNYVAQSQTTYSEYNPGYKVYKIEGSFSGSKFRVLDHYNYILDLDQANLLNITNFFQLYQASVAYDMPDLSPQSWLDVVNKMMPENSTVFDLFYRNYVKGGRPSMEKGCDQDCKNSILCRLLVTDNSDHSHCVDAGLE